MNKTESARCVRCNKEFVVSSKLTYKEAYEKGFAEAVRCIFDAVNLMTINIFSTCVKCTDELLTDDGMMR